MKKEDISDALNMLNDDILQEANEVRSNKKKNRNWRKWGAVAACLCLLVAVFPVKRLINANKNQDKGVDPIALLELSGCYYEACSKERILEKYGLPAKITEDMAGQHLLYLESDGGAGYKVTSAQTNIELYEYAPNPCRAVYVLRDGNSYKAALFCNIIGSDTNTSYELRDLYKFYGIEGAEDIASISHVDWHKEKAVGNTVTDTEAISAFYNITLALAGYSNDDFQAEVFGKIPENQQVAVHTDFANDNTTIRIEATSGLRLFIEVFPDYGWIYGGGTMKYYKMNDAMHQWFDTNIK